MGNSLLIMATELKPATSVTGSEMDRSFRERYGDRYYEVDHSYDKRVYENTFLNYMRIIFTLIFFWIFQAIHWWGVFELGINWSPYLMWYSVAIFVFTILVGAGLLTSGKFANKQKRFHTYLTDKIAEQKAKALEEKLKKEQAAQYAAKMGEQIEEEPEAPAANNYAINEGSQV